MNLILNLKPILSKKISGTKKMEKALCLTTLKKRCVPVMSVGSATNRQSWISVIMKSVSPALKASHVLKCMRSISNKSTLLRTI